MNTKAEENQELVRHMLYERQPHTVLAIILTEIEIEDAERNYEQRYQPAESDPPSCSIEEWYAGRTVGFGDLDFEHGAIPPRLGSDDHDADGYSYSPDDSWWIS